VQNICGDSADETVTTFSLDYDAPTTAGNLLVLAVYEAYSAAFLLDVADNAGNTWVQAVASNDGLSSATQIWYVVNALPATTVTITPNTEAFFQASVSEWIPIHLNLSVLRGTNSGSGTGTAASTGSVSAVKGDLCIAVIGANTTNTFAETGGWSDLYADFMPNLRTDMRYLIPSANASETEDWTISSSTAWCAAMAVFKAQ
jgi:hypothetical protein